MRFAKWALLLVSLVDAGITTQRSRPSTGRVGSRRLLRDVLQHPRSTFGRSETSRRATDYASSRRIRSRVAMDSAAGTPEKAPESERVRKLSYPLDVLVVGGGIGGLTLAKTLKEAGANVKVTERADIETIKLRAAGGPIQLASNALGVLQRIDPVLFEKIREQCTVTGLRTNGLKDGKTGDWYLEFDTKTPASKRQLPPTAVIDRPDLQQMLINDLDGVVDCGRDMVKYVNLPNGKVEARYADGTVETADLLIGADGIWSQVRAQMHEDDRKSATYSGFTVFAGICSYTPKDIQDVGYKVFMGKAKYFVATDIGKGRIQWYAFIGQDADSVLPEGQEALDWLNSEVFGEWTDEVKELITATPVKNVESRALYDRPPQIFRSWSDGQVGLIGDAIHPMMPNLGQGGCMAIEDAYVLAEELAKIDGKDQVKTALQKYRLRRQVRTAAVQGLSRFGAEMLLRFFDHPFRVEMENGLPKFINFGYLSFLMAAWKVLGVLDTTFKLQFSYLFEEP